MSAAGVSPLPGAPSLSRRQFLVAVSVAGATAVAVNAPGVDWARVPELSELLVASTFQPLLGRSFRLAVPGADPVTLRLEEVDGVSAAGPTERAFLLRFSGPEAARQGGEVGMLRTRGLPPMPLLVVPTGLPVAGRQQWTVTVVSGGA